jgi:riboflavin biosynthesis pyrimidine reductase
VRELRADQNLLIWGSPTLVQSLLDAGLVDELVLLYSPIVRGEGIRLYRDGQKHKLRVTEATRLSGGMLGVRLEA